VVSKSKDEGETFHFYLDLYFMTRRVCYTTTHKNWHTEYYSQKPK